MTQQNSIPEDLQNKFSTAKAKGGLRNLTNMLETAQTYLVTSEIELNNCIQFLDEEYKEDYNFRLNNAAQATGRQ